MDERFCLNIKVCFGRGNLFCSSTVCLRSLGQVNGSQCDVKESDTI